MVVQEVQLEQITKQVLELSCKGAAVKRPLLSKNHDKQKTGYISNKISEIIDSLVFSKEIVPNVAFVNIILTKRSS